VLAEMTKSHSMSLTQVNNAIFLDFFILFSSCWFPKSDSKCAQCQCHSCTSNNWPVKMTCGVVGAQCTMSCSRKWNWQMANGVRRATHRSAWTHINLTSPYSPHPHHWTLVNALQAIRKMMTQNDSERDSTTFCTQAARKFVKCCQMSPQLAVCWLQLTQCRTSY